MHFVEVFDQKSVVKNRGANPAAGSAKAGSQLSNQVLGWLALG